MAAEGANDLSVVFENKHQDTDVEVPLGIPESSFDRKLEELMDRSSAELELSFERKRPSQIATKARMVRLESEIGQYQREAKRAKIEVEQTKEKVTEVEQKSETRIRELERQRSILLTRQETLKEELEETQDRSQREKRKLELQIKNLTGEEESLRSKLEEAWNTAQRKEGVLDPHVERQLETNASKINEMKHEISQYQKEAAASNLKIATLEVSKGEYEQRVVIAEHRVKELEHKLESNLEKVKAVEQSHSQLIRYSELERKWRTLEKENTYLKKVSDSNALLHEQISSLENKLTRAEERLVETTKLELDNQELKKLCQQWEAPGALGGIKFRSPSEMTTMLADLQRKEVVLSGQKSQLKADLDISEATLKAVQEKAACCEQKLAQEQEKSRKDAETVKRLERKVHFLKMERDSIREILKSYETDIENNEAKAEANLLAARKEIQGLWQKIEGLQAELEKSQTTSDSHDPSGTGKVLRYCGPESILDAGKAKYEGKLALLRKDNEELRLQLIAALAGKIDGKPVGVGLKFELDHLKEKLQQAETYRKRLEQVMKTKVMEYRDAVNAVLGFRLDLLQDSTCKLRSIYAEKDDVLKFKVTNGGREVAMIDTSFSASVSADLIDTYVTKHRSFPAFLAAITLDLISKHTLMQL